MERRDERKEGQREKIKEGGKKKGGRNDDNRKSKRIKIEERGKRKRKRRKEVM